MCCNKNYQHKFDEKLLDDVFENFRNMCLEIHELDTAKFLSAPRLVWQAALKKTKVKLDLLTDIYILLMVEKGIGGRYKRENMSLYLSTCKS